MMMMMTTTTMMMMNLQAEQRGVIYEEQIVTLANRLKDVRITKVPFSTLSPAKQQRRFHVTNVQGGPKNCTFPFA